MLLISCVNCCFNGLQSDTVGMSVGYCVEHKKVLQTPSETTCGRLLRKDLSIEAAEREHESHKARFSPALISIIRTRAHANGGHTSLGKADLDSLRKDEVADVVTDYGLLHTKIESLAQLSALKGVRAQLAMLSLGRTYVRRCNARHGAWTSGLHLVWSVRKRLPEEPEIPVSDYRVETSLPLARQEELAKWSMTMFRLIFLSDVGSYARSTTVRFRSLATLAEDAAVASGELSFKKLFRWVRDEAIRRFDKALPESLYQKMSRDLHRETDRHG